MYKYLSFTLLFLSPTIVCSVNYSLTEMEKKSISMANKWMNNNTDIIKQSDGSISFYYGDNMPSLICKPFNATVIKLEKGERIQNLRCGDPSRWQFDKIDGDRPFLLVKPNKANLMTNLIIFTDRRVYNIKLVATSKSWLPGISFIYDKSDTHKDYSDSSTKPKDTNIITLDTPSKSNHKNTNIKKAQYNIISNSSWKPKNVFNKHGKTYITIGDWNINNLPRLYILSGKSLKFTYKYKNRQLVVNGIIKKAILIKDGFRKSIIKIRRTK